MRTVAVHEAFRSFLIELQPGRPPPSQRIAEDNPLCAPLLPVAVPRLPVSHSAADDVFFASDESTQADIFLSYEWGIPRWRSWLSLSFHLNLRVATAGAIAGFCCGIGGTIAVSRTTLQQLGEGQSPSCATLYSASLALPSAAFVALLLCGHHLFRGCDERRVFSAALCVHQSRSNLKRRALAALPEILGKTSRLLVLLSESYPTRLWPFAELAIFCAANATVDGKPSAEMVTLLSRPLPKPTAAADCHCHHPLLPCPTPCKNVSLSPHAPASHTRSISSHCGALRGS